MWHGIAVPTHAPLDLTGATGVWTAAAIEDARRRDRATREVGTCHSFA